MSIYTGNPRALTPEGFLSWADEAVKTLEGHGYRLPEYVSPLCWEEMPEGLLAVLSYEEGTLTQVQLQVTWGEEQGAPGFRDVMPNAVLARGVIRSLETVASAFTGTVEGSIVLKKHASWKHLMPGETAQEATRRMLLVEDRQSAASCRDLIFVSQTSTFSVESRYEMLWWLKSAGLVVPAFGGPMSPPMIERIWESYKEQLQTLTLYEVKGLLACFNDSQTARRLGKFFGVVLTLDAPDKRPKLERDHEENEYEEQE